MPTALRHKIEIPGVVLPWVVPTRELQSMTTKFWGVKGESRIDGNTAGRTLEIPVIVYHATRFNTQAKLSQFLDRDVQNMVGELTTLVVTSESDRPPFNYCSFEGALTLDGPKLDFAGTLGGGAWAHVLFVFRQHQ